MGRKKKTDWAFVLPLLIIIVIVIAIIVYIISLGKIDFIDDIETTIRKRNLWIENRIRKLKNLYSAKSDLKKHLDKTEAKIFKIVRIVFTSFFLISNGLIFYYCDADGFYARLGCTLNVDQAVFIIYLSLVFIFTKKLSDVTFIFRLIHLKIKKMVYTGFESVAEDLIKIQLEITKLETEKNENLEKIRLENEAKLKESQASINFNQENQS